jgi:outer membrane protein assembly factor BamB
MRRTLLISSVLPLLLIGAAPSADRVKAARPEICGLGILAPAGKVLFLPGPSDSIEAVALFNGKRLWETKGASKLLLATDDKVFAQTQVKGKRNQVKIVVLDATTGERLLESERITFPAWVSVPPDYGRSFRSAARLDRGDLVYIWKARTFHDGGEPLPNAGPDGKPYVDPNAREASGAMRVDLSSGKVTVVKDYRPKESDFFEDRPTWAGPAKRQGRVFRVEQDTSTNSGMPHSLIRQILKAKTQDGKRSWQRDIIGEVNLPPRP